MRKTIFPSIIAVTSGVLTGLIVYLAMFGIKSEISKLTVNIYCISFAIISLLAMHVFTKLFTVIFNNKSDREYGINGWIFSIPLVLIFALFVYVKYYLKLSLLTPEVLGNIYIPFHGYTHVNMASFFLISAVGAVWLAVVFIMAIRFIMSFYSFRKNNLEKESVKHIFLFAFIFYVLTTSFVTFVYPPTGDEPHYLIVAQSIAADFDFNLENNYTEKKNYEGLYPVALDYKGLHTIKGNNGTGVYTTHDVGLSFLIAPFVKIGGRYPTQLLVNFLAALLCVMLYLMLLRLGIAPNFSAIAAMSAGMAMPLLAGASLILTEIPAALLVAFCVYTLLGKTIGKRNLLFFAAMAFMPWLHVKLIIFPVVFYCYYYYLVIKNKSFNLKTEFINNLFVLVSAGLYVWYYYAVYGIIAPFGLKALHENIYSAIPTMQVNKFVINPFHFVTSALAAFFDRDYGLLPYCLFYVLSFWGIISVLNKKQFTKLIPLLLCVPYLILFLLWEDWTGSMTPARQLIPIIPVLIYYGIYFLSSNSFIKTKIFKLIAVLSFFVSWLLLVVPPLRYAASKDKLYAFASMHAPHWLVWFLPPFRDNLLVGIIQSIIYLLIIIFIYMKYSSKEKNKHKI
ncbi:MAG: hypothetical protein WCJ94_01955 [bacterium]